MSEYSIRKYQDKDYETARVIFSHGMREHTSAAFWYILSRPQTLLLFLVVFLLIYVASASFLFSLGILTALLAVGWNEMKVRMKDYIQEVLDGDLLDIQGTYLESKDGCFWVVDNGEEVVATVAAIHPEEPSLRGRALELKRMSVKKEHRGHGLSKALTRTVIRFAQERGYKEVVLSTSVVQHVAQRLYESMGFHRVKVICLSFVYNLLPFHIYVYRYEITGTYLDTCLLPKVHLMHR